jgi:UTP--glucose-1-phosphate uridylyltransferase|tara:strand:+ start:519 stop:1382 length:864 start_codon:yes stop_codon:yes gene_type:complete
MKTAVITTGGLGTRMLTFTKGNPKTMLPLYTKSNDNYTKSFFKPLIEIIFENLYDQGFRKFCFIVGQKTKNSIMNHMLPDTKFINLLKSRNFPEDKIFIDTLVKFYTKIINSEIKWIIQPTPAGFGDALLKSKKFVGKDDFLLHAGDAYFPEYEFLENFIKKHENSKNVSASILIKKMKILKGYGIAQVKKHDSENLIIGVEEKPKKPKSNLAILPVYIFNSNIFKALKETSKGYKSELQVTDAVMTLINEKEKVLGFNYGNKKWFDIGSPSNYFNALTYSYKRTFN